MVILIFRPQTLLSGTRHAPDIMKYHHIPPYFVPAIWKTKTAKPTNAAQFTVMQVLRTTKEPDDEGVS